MIIRTGSKIVIVLLAGSLFFQCCKSAGSKTVLKDFRYERFKDSFLLQQSKELHDTTNYFDGVPPLQEIDTTDRFLIRIDTLWHREVLMLENMVALVAGLKNDTIPQSELERLKENVRVLDSFLTNKDNKQKITCQEKECLLFADVVKSKQQLYLYIEGVLKDSFKVSTGMKDYETDNFSVRPSGPLFVKYTSRKFPGGNYKGLGNMPYAVFLLGGYAIHGTTPGNFPKLGTVASHGCIRLHPDNAKIFYELVKLIGLKNTWVTVRD